MRRLVLALACVLLAAPAEAQSFPARSGESGLLDVPDAEVVGVGNGSLASELKLDGGRSRTSVGPLPVYATAGLARAVEIGLSMRDGGQPGDPTPNRMLFGGALKLRLIDGSRALVSLGVDGYLDRFNDRGAGGGRFLLSSSASRPVRLATFVGYEVGREDGLTYGAAVSIAATRRTTLVLEGLDGPRGANVGVALWHRFWNNVPVSLGFNRLVDDRAYRVTLGIAFSPSRRVIDAADAEARPAPAAAAAEEAVASAAPRFTEERPHFRLTLRGPAALSSAPRSLRHGPWNPSLAAAGARGPAAATAPGLRGAAPSLEDLADAQLREQEGLAEARERRVRATAEQLDGRDKALQDEANRLAERERELAAREQQLDLRERRLARGTPTQQQRDLEALATQLAAQERNLSAQERSFGPAIDAAQGRERDAASREDAERAEASRLAASVSGAGARGQQVEVRKQALSARNRQLAAFEARLVARGERIDALERQLRARGERFDAWQRRLDIRSELLDVREKAAAGPTTALPVPPAAGGAKAAVPAKDKAIFVMVVKSPTAILKERAGTAATVAPGAIQPGTAVEKAIAAATVVTFPNPTAQLSELDRETIDNIAKLAAREGSELLIWARAKDPSLMGEAQRRATEIRSRVMAVAPLADKQVVTRITTRPGAQGVDVVVSALRDVSRPAAAAGAAAAGAARPAGSLEAGEAGKRQIREAVQAAQPSIEACVGELMEQKKLARAEGSLKLTISAAGKVVKVLSGDGDLSGSAIQECLTAASGGWSFPPADAEYAVEVPITVIRGGAR